MILFVAMMVIASGMLFGYSLASIAGVLDVIARTHGLAIYAQQLLVAAIPASCFVGAILAWPLSARYGRRQGLGVAFVIAIVGSAMLVLGPDVELLFAGRAMVGLAVGLSSMIAPMYAGEIASVRYRGAVVASFQLAVTLGILASYAVPYLMPQVQWPVVLGLGGLAAILGLVSLVVLPESPRWLAAIDMERATRAARRLGIAYNLLDAKGDHSKLRSMNLRQSLFRGSTIAVLVLCSLLFVLQNLSGIDGVLYYAPHIMRELGYSEDRAAIAATFGLGLVNFLATVVALWLVERAGRRPLLIAGSMLMAAGLFAAVAGSFLQIPVLGMLGLCVYILAFAISLGPLPYVLMAELFPSTLRESGIAAASAVSWLFNMLVALTFLSLAEAIGLVGVLIIFALICVLALIIAVLFVPETRGRSLEELERDVISGIRIRKVGQAIA